MKKIDFILCGDIHLRENAPVCRTEEEFEIAQWVKLKFIDDLALEHDCPILVAGDFFDHWKPSPELLSKTMKCLSAKWYSIYGDHDLPQHNFKLNYKSGLTTLAEAGKVIILNGGHGKDKNNTKLKDPLPSRNVQYPFKDGHKGRKIFVWHVLTWKKEIPYPGCTISNAKQLLKRYPQFDCIVTGDNHKPFIERHKGRMLVNVGSMMRIRADQIKYKPAVWLYNAESNDVEPVYLPIVKGVVSRQHIEENKERDERIDAFVSKLKKKKQQKGTNLNFEENIKRFCDVNKVKKSVIQIINNVIE